ncbi:hypothetical protein OVN18_08360 [Microcella daejeonensis]|uniref:Histidine kinase/HSP90-like ATPase domain-containing protein n=1 Tax=Microcella daejeonensis TaxID=2994971 RepID=A0A9E8MKR4_9MICO|nr:ATP-binding protein [Microcella daejeonensis]WAB80581.1 hypothetical protein OVN18_08360 [Microcella daejeonensis]
MTALSSVQGAASSLSLPPPRDVTASSLIRGLATAERIIGVASLGLSFGLVLDLAARQGADDGPLTGVLLTLWLAPLLIVAVAHLLRPRALSGAAVLAIGVLSTAGWAATILTRSTPEESHGSFLLETTAWTLALIGAVQPTARSGVLWSALGLLAGTAGLVLGSLVVGAPVTLSPDRFVDGGIVIIAYLVVALGWRRTRGRLPALPQVERATREAHARRLRERAAAAVVHDTLLSSLTLVARAPEGVVDARLERLIRRDLRVVGTAEVTAAGTASTSSDLLPLRLVELADGFRWRGLRVDVSGVDAVPELERQAAEALVEAVAAALDNVSRHSGSASAEVTIGTSERAVTVMVVDTGRGFDPEGVDVERMGVRESIVGRIERLGGRVRIFSGGTGTTVVLSLPLATAGSGAEPRPAGPGGGSA